MTWPDAEVLRALSPTVVLLLVVLLLARAWVKDRNARIEDLKLQVHDLRTALVASEAAREKDRDTARLSLETALAAEQMIRAIRQDAQEGST